MASKMVSFLVAVVLVLNIFVVVVMGESSNAGNITMDDCGEAGQARKEAGPCRRYNESCKKNEPNCCEGLICYFKNEARTCDYKCLPANQACQNGKGPKCCKGLTCVHDNIYGWICGVKPPPSLRKL